MIIKIEVTDDSGFKIHLPKEYRLLSSNAEEEQKANDFYLNRLIPYTEKLVAEFKSNFNKETRNLKK